VTELVVITPKSGNDSDGDPVEQGDPVTLVPWEVAPGNLLMRYGAGGDFTDVEFTVYLPHRSRMGINTYTETMSLVHNGDQIEVRGKRCVAWVQLWQSSRTLRGGVVVLARSKSGKAA